MFYRKINYSSKNNQQVNGTTDLNKASKHYHLKYN